MSIIRLAQEITVTINNTRNIILSKSAWISIKINFLKVLELKQSFAAHSCSDNRQSLVTRFLLVQLKQRIKQKQDLEKQE